MPVAARSGSAGVQGTAGSDQPILRLSHRDPGVTVERHPAAPLAGIPKVWLSASGFSTGFSSHPLSYDKGEFPAGAVNRAVSSQGRRLGLDHRATSAMLAKYTGWVTALGHRAGENGVKRTAGDPG